MESVKATYSFGEMTYRMVVAIMVMLGTMALAGCADEPSAINSVGNQLLLSHLSVRTDTLSAVGSSTFKKYVPMDGQVNLVGRTGGYTAYTLIQFFPFYIPERDTVTVVSATLELLAETWFGDSAGSLGFNVYQINHSWGQSTLQWDSVSTDPVFFDAGTARGTYAGTVSADSEWMSVNLDTAMVRRWIQPLIYTDNFGIILVPTQNCSVVRGLHAFGFGADSLFAHLTVVARNVAGTVTDTTIYRLGQDTFLGNIDDLNTNPSLMYVQSGVAYRSTLKFDVTGIPRGAIINQAQLTLRYDPGSSRLNKFVSDTAVAAHALLDPSDYSKFELTGSRGTGAIASSDSFRFDLRHQVQYWLSNPSLNNGLLLRATSVNEFSSFGLFTFYNETAQDFTKRPQLVVKYTVESN